MSGIEAVIGRIGEIVQRIAPPTAAPTTDFAAVLNDAEATGVPETAGDDIGESTRPPVPTSIWLTLGGMIGTASAFERVFTRPGFASPLPALEAISEFGTFGVGRDDDHDGHADRRHAGVDWNARTGTPISSVASGEVIRSGWLSEGAGFGVEIDHGDGWTSRYFHMNEVPPVAVGQSVRDGDIIGGVGNTGHSSGPHLHFEIRLNGQPQDPATLIPGATFQA